MQKRSVRGFTLAELLIGLAVVGGLCLAIFAGTFQSDWTYSRKVTGQVVSTGSRYQRGESGGREKIALQLNPFKSDNKTAATAGGADGIAVECVSTRCASLMVGQCAQFVCSYEHRWWEPSVMECKMEKTIACASLGVKPLPMPATAPPTATPSATPPMPMSTQDVGEDW